MEMRDQVHELTRDARAILRPQDSDVDMASVEGTFTIRASQPVIHGVASGPVVMAVTQLAPRMCLRLEARPQKDVQPLREGVVDLDISLLGTSAPEIRTRFLCYDAYVRVVRVGHPILAGKQVIAQNFAAFNHVLALQEGYGIESLRNDLETLGLERRITVVVPGYPDAMRIACRPELIAVVPRSCLGSARLEGSTLELPSLIFPRPSHASRYRRCGIPVWKQIRYIAA